MRRFSITIQGRYARLYHTISADDTLSAYEKARNMALVFNGVLVELNEVKNGR